MSEIANRNVVITGGSRGIGVHLAHAFAGQGAHLALVARSQEGLQNVAAQLENYGTTVAVFPADLALEQERVQLVRDIRQRFGPIDILVNNAGLESDGPFTDLSWATIRRTVEVNLLAPMALTHHILPEMLVRNHGHLVNISSIAAKSGAAYDAVYGGTKAGLAEWTRALRLELHDTGVRFSTIMPGYVRETGMFAKFGVKAPWLPGSCSPDQVARAVIRAVQKNTRERVVNSQPLRWYFALNDLWPALADWIQQAIGAIDFQREKSERLRQTTQGTTDES